MVRAYWHTYTPRYINSGRHFPYQQLSLLRLKYRLLPPAYPLTGDTSSTPRSMDGPSHRGEPSAHVSPGSEYRGRASCPGPSLRGCTSLGTGCRNMRRVYGSGQRACASSVAQVSSRHRYTWHAFIIAICVPHRDSFENGRGE